MHRLIHDVLEGDNFPAQPRAIAGDNHFALGIRDTVCQRLIAKATIDHAVRCADLGTRQHGDHNFGGASHVNGDGIPLAHAHAPQDVGELVHLLIQAPIGIGALFAVFSLPNDGKFVASPSFDVAIYSIEGDVGLATNEPLIEGGFTVIQHLIPLLIPFQRFGTFCPKGFGISNRTLIHRLIIGNVCVLHNGSGREIPFGFRGY